MYMASSGYTPTYRGWSLEQPWNPGTPEAIESTLSLSKLEFLIK